MATKWTQEELEYITDNKNKISYQEMAQEINRTADAISRKMGKLGLIENNSWCETEVEYIRNNFMTSTCRQIGKHLGKNVGSVEQQARKLGLQKQIIDLNKKNESVKLGLANRRPWSEDEKELLKSTYMETSYEEIAYTLDRSEMSVAHKINQLGLKKEHKNENWSDEELAYLKNNYATAKTADLLKVLPKRNLSAIYNKVYELGFSNTRGTKAIYDTKPELIIRDWLDKNNIKYIAQAKVLGRYFKIDFLVGKLAIEVNGDFWHCNPSIYTEPTCSIQIKNIEKDKDKYTYLELLGYKVLLLWESDIYDNFEGCTHNILSEVAVLAQTLQEN